MQGDSLCKYVDLDIQSEIFSCRIDIKDPVLGTQRHQWKSPNDRMNRPFNAHVNHGFTSWTSLMTPEAIPMIITMIYR